MVRNNIPKIKSTAKDMANFYSGDSDLSPKGIYKWAKNGLNSSSARDAGTGRIDIDALGRALPNKLNSRDLPTLEVRPRRKR